MFDFKLFMVQSEIQETKQNIINQYTNGWNNGTLSQINWQELYLKNSNVPRDANGKRAIYL